MLIIVTTKKNQLKKYIDNDHNKRLNPFCILKEKREFQVESLALLHFALDCSVGIIS